ncbi:hypothetical protein Syun_014008 [Stephania yunnanensis]|uniref:Uncharacterized protein n=1 Tax=Stephania yunnanensis TaxID=152371 RepID=A0AAP0P876_9MAGN
MSRANIIAENAIVMADVVIAFLYGVEDEKEEMVMAATTHIGRATTSIASVMPP